MASNPGSTYLGTTEKMPYPPSLQVPLESAGPPRGAVNRRPQTNGRQVTVEKKDRLARLVSAWSILVRCMPVSKRPLKGPTGQALADGLKDFGRQQYPSP
jgi:hypothetical protein